MSASGAAPIEPSAEENKGPWIKSDGADIFFACLIVLNSIVLGVDIEVSLRNGGDSGPVLFWIQFGFLVIFVVELLLRVKASGLEFFSICRNPSGLFDVIIVGTSITEFVVNLNVEGGESPLGAVSVMRIFRLLRIARVARLLNVCPELSLLVGGLAASIQAVFWVFCLLVVIMYICALICCTELGRTDDEELRYYFGSVGSSFWTHFMVVTLEGYPSVAAAAGQESWLWYLYIVGFILFSNVVLMNLVTGIVCESIVTKAEDEESQSQVYEEESRKFGEVMFELLSVQGYSAESELCFEDFERVVRVPEVREALNVLEICLDMEDRALWDILDEDGMGKLSLMAFIANLLRLRGSKDVLHSLVVQADIIRGGRNVREAFDEAEAGAHQYATSVCGALQNKLLQRLSQLPGQDEDTPASRRPPSRRKAAPPGRRPASRPEAAHGAAPPEEDASPSRGERRPHGRHVVLRPEATHGAAQPAEDVRPAATCASSRPSRDAEELRPDASIPLAASVVASRDAEDVRPTGAASITASRASLDAEEVRPHTSIPLAASRAASRTAEEVRSDVAAAEAAAAAACSREEPRAADTTASAAASRPSRSAEEPPAAAAAPPAASRPSRNAEEAHSNTAATAAASRPSRNVEEPPSSTPAPATASRGPLEEASAATAAAPAVASSGSRANEAARSPDPEPPQAEAAAAAAAEEGLAPEQPPVPSTEARVQGILAELESSSSEARQTLSRLGEDLAASRNRIRELEAELARRKEASRSELERRADEAASFSWPSQCSPRAIIHQGQSPVSARELRLLPGVEPRRRPAAVAATDASEAAEVSLAGPSAAWDRRAAAGGELERALQHVWKRQSPPPAAAAAPPAAASAPSSPAAASPPAWGAVAAQAAAVGASRGAEQPPPLTAALAAAASSPTAAASPLARGVVAAAAAAAASPSGAKSPPSAASPAAAASSSAAAASPLARGMVAAAAAAAASPSGAKAASPAAAASSSTAAASPLARGMVAAAAAAASPSGAEASPKAATVLSATEAGVGVVLAGTAATPRTAVPRAAAPPRAAARSECMSHRRRLEAAYASVASPKPAAAPAAGRPRGGAPRQRYLNAFHGHSTDHQSIAKAATYESSDEEQGGGHARAESSG